MNATFATAVSGLLAQSKRLAVSAANVVNIRSLGVDPDAAAPDPEAFIPHRTALVSDTLGGVRAQAVPVTPPSVPALEPNDPAADADGVVHRPNVSLAQEFVTQLQALRAYQANLRVIEAENEMLGELLDTTS